MNPWERRHPCRRVSTPTILPAGMPALPGSGSSGAQCAQGFRGDLSPSARERVGMRLHRPELLVFVVLLVLFNAPVLTGSCFTSLIFHSEAVRGGDWWRLLTHPFVHVTWYHLLLDGSAF